MTTLASEAQTTEPASRDNIQVMIVDDSAVVRGLVSRWIDENPDMEVCGRYPNGQLALGGVERCNPDVILLDIEMPVMDGLTALPELLKLRPESKVIIASTLSRRNAEISLKALSLGATDYIPKPESNRGITTSREFREELVRKIRAVCGSTQDIDAGVEDHVAEAPVAEAKSGIPARTDKAPVDTGAIQLRSFSMVTPRILVVGSSTGGPQALAKLMEAIAPSTAHLPIVITQHMPPTFTSILAEHLARISGRTSKEGEDGELIQPGCIYVAPGGNHMKLIRKNEQIALSIYDGPLINFCKPAVDPMFESAAELYGSAVLGLVLTGMGNDGANGALAIADAGGAVIAQDEATSVVWGMPGATARAGACAAVLPLAEIGQRVTTLLRGEHR